MLAGEEAAASAVEVEEDLNAEEDEAEEEDALAEAGNGADADSAADADVEVVSIGQPIKKENGISFYRCVMFRLNAAPRQGFQILLCQSAHPAKLLQAFTVISRTLTLARG